MQMQQSMVVTVTQEGDWFIASCSQVPGANGQGKTREAALKNLEEAVNLLRVDQELSESVTFTFA